MFMSGNRIVGLGIYRGYCMLRRQFLTELVFAGGDVCTYSLADSVATKRFRTIGHWKLLSGEPASQMFLHTI